MARSASPPVASASTTSSCHIAVYSTRARMPSAYDFCSIRLRRTSGWWVTVTGAVLSSIWVRVGALDAVLA